MDQRCIIVGASARAAAQSACRAGWRPMCVDLFGDRDLRAAAELVRVCPWPAYPDGLLDAVADLPSGLPLFYTGAIENHPELIEAFARRFTLQGCDASAVRLARDPVCLSELPELPGLRACRVANHAGQVRSQVRSQVRYLIKPRRSAGGRRIAFWQAGTTPGQGMYLQQYVAGDPVAAVYVAFGSAQHSAGPLPDSRGLLRTARGADACRLIGVTRQLVGQSAWHAPGPFAYVGSVGPIDLDAQLTHALTVLGEHLTSRCGLRGVFGVDLILDRDGALWPVEINPRYTASMEILEQTLGISLLAGHLDVPTIPRRAGCGGKAIAFAPAAMTLPDLYDLLDKSQVADVPAAGQQVRLGEPICTLLARGNDAADCLAQLHDLGSQLYTRLS